MCDESSTGLESDVERAIALDGCEEGREIRNVLEDAGYELDVLQEYRSLAPTTGEQWEDKQRKAADLLFRSRGRYSHSLLVCSGLARQLFVGVRYDLQILLVKVDLEPFNIQLARPVTLIFCSIWLVMVVSVFGNFRGVKWAPEASSALIRVCANRDMLRRSSSHVDVRQAFHLGKPSQLGI